MTAPDHLIIAPILIPFIAGAVMLLYDESQRRAKLALSPCLHRDPRRRFCSSPVRATPRRARSASTCSATGRCRWQSSSSSTGCRQCCLLLGALLALPALVYSAAGWHRQGQHFHSLFQFFLMGLNGTFLTGDLFNLFVFFEVLLAASYGLLAPWLRRARVLAGLHFHRHQPRGLAPLPDRRRDHLWRDRHAQHGRSRPPRRHSARARPAALPRRRGAPRHRLPGQGGDLATRLLVLGAYGASSAPVVAMFAIATKVGVYGAQARHVAHRAGSGRPRRDLGPRCWRSWAWRPLPRRARRARLSGTRPCHRASPG